MLSAWHCHLFQSMFTFFIAEETIFNSNKDRSPILLEEDVELPSFGLDAIANATNNFSSTNKIGEGGFGTVYKVIFFK